MVASEFHGHSATRPSVPYDSERDLAPIMMVAKNSMLFLVNPKVPANSLAEFVAGQAERAIQLRLAGRGHPNPPGGRTVQPQGRHQAAAHPLSRRRARHDRDGRRRNPPHGDLDLAVAAAAPAGALRAIATGNLDARSTFRDLPTVAEQGYPGFEAIQWIPADHRGHAGPR